MKLVKILGITFLFTVFFAVSVAAGCAQAGLGSLRLLTGTILPYDDEGCEARTAFTGCHSMSNVHLMDNYLSVSASYKYTNKKGNLVTISDSRSGNDVLNVNVRLEGDSDDGISATSKHIAKCYVDNNNYSKTITKTY